jgi:hypothetical protein
MNTRFAYWWPAAPESRCTWTVSWLVAQPIWPGGFVGAVEVLLAVGLADREVLDGGADEDVGASVLRWVAVMLTLPDGRAGEGALVQAVPHTTATANAMARVPDRYRREVNTGLILLVAGSVDAQVGAVRHVGLLRRGG